MDPLNRDILPECFTLPPTQVSGHLLIVHWILIGWAILFTLIIVLFLWSWKEGWRSLCHCVGFSCWMGSVSPNENHSISLITSPLNTVLPPATTPFTVRSRSEHQQVQSLCCRCSSEMNKIPLRNCDSRHWEQTRRLEKWHSTHSSNPSSACFISMQSLSVKKELSLASVKRDDDESHTYEEIDIGFQNGRTGYNNSEITRKHTSKPVSDLQNTSFYVNQSLYEPHCKNLCQPALASTSPSVVIESQVISSHKQKCLIHSALRKNTHLSCRWDSGSIISTPYFPQSSDSGDSASFSDIYICPEPYPED